MKPNLQIYDIDLPIASKKIISEFLSRGASCTKLSNTNLYVVNFDGRNFNFYEDFTPLIPYMIGIILSRRYFWEEILKNSKINVFRKMTKNRQKLRVFITKNYFYNVLLEKKLCLVGDGKSTLGDLIRIENIKRINSDNLLLMPIKISSKTDLTAVINKSESIFLEHNSDYEDITKLIDGSVVEIAAKIIDLFPGIGYLCFEFFTKDFGKKSSYSVGNIIISPGLNMFVELIKGNQSERASKQVLRDILRR